MQLKDCFCDNEWGGIDSQPFSDSFSFGIMDLFCRARHLHDF
jgi:hypothetical protein